MPRGGARIGAGRKPKSDHHKKLEGSRDRLNRPAAGAPSAPPPAQPLVVIKAPKSLTVEQRKEWRIYAPLAIAEGTLTPATVGAFVELLETIVCRREILENVKMEGLTITDKMGNLKKHPLLAEARSLLQRIETARKNFRLAPFGKSLAPPKEEEVDPFAEFDGPLSLIQGGRA